MFVFDNTEDLARVHNILNHWQWPDELGEKPENWDTMPDHSKDNSVNTKYKIIMPIMNKIENKIGQKECLRWHHLNNLNRSNEQFEDWWENEYNQ